MTLELTMEQATETQVALHETVVEMSHEIAATDNPFYRHGLKARRQALVEVTALIGALLSASCMAPN